MNVVLEVSVGDIIYALSGKSEDPVFKEALALATRKQKNSGKDFVTLFGESFQEVDPNAQTGLYFPLMNSEIKASQPTSQMKKYWL